VIYGASTKASVKLLVVCMRFAYPRIMRAHSLNTE